MLRPLGNTGYRCHSLGFGCYRINEGNPVHEAALRAYLNAGGNLVDTSSNYGDGLSEILVGRVVKDFVREQIIVVTKAGYMQGQNLELAQRRDFPEVVKYADGLWHCIHPEFLLTQIDQSLRRLKLDYIDVFLLHNPEYYINHQARVDPITDTVLDEFYRRIRRAFEFLELEAGRGRIRYYGISSNNFGFHLGDRARVSVLRSLEQARLVSSEHRFRVVQLPVNIFESGGAIFDTDNGRTFLENCVEHQLGVLTNRPLNAIHGHRMVRLADFVTSNDSVVPPLEAKLKDLADAEEEYVRTFDGEPFGGEHEGLAAYLKFIAGDLPSPDQWDQVLNQYIIPPVTLWLRNAHGLFADRPAWKDWQERYVAVVNQALDDVQRHLQRSKQSESDRFRRMLHNAGYPRTEASLSRIALSLVSRLPGVSSVLCGMRSPAYVEDAFGSLELEAVDASKILHHLSEEFLATSTGDDR